jgi:hypothetical protein
MTEGSPGFRLSVWRPARPSRKLVVSSSENDQEEHRMVSLRPGDLLEEIYSWHPGEADPLTPLDGGRAENYRRILLEPFRAERPAQERGMNRFREALGQLDREVPSQPQDWASTSEPPPPDLSSEESSLDANVPLALRLHLRWVLTIFEHVPGASVLIQ